MKKIENWINKNIDRKTRNLFLLLLFTEVIIFALTNIPKGKDWVDITSDFALPLSVALFSFLQFRFNKKRHKLDRQDKIWEKLFDKRIEVYERMTSIASLFSSSIAKIILINTIIDKEDSKDLIQKNNREFREKRTKILKIIIETSTMIPILFTEKVENVFQDFFNPMQKVLSEIEKNLMFSIYSEKDFAYVNTKHDEKKYIHIYFDSKDLIKIERKNIKQNQEDIQNVVNQIGPFLGKAIKKVKESVEKAMEN